MGWIDRIPRRAETARDLWPPLNRRMRHPWMMPQSPFGRPMPGQAMAQGAAPTPAPPTPMPPAPPGEIPSRASVLGRGPSSMADLEAELEALALQQDQGNRQTDAIRGGGQFAQPPGMLNPMTQGGGGLYPMGQPPQGAPGRPMGLSGNLGLPRGPRPMPDPNAPKPLGRQPNPLLTRARQQDALAGISESLGNMNPSVAGDYILGGGPPQQKPFIAASTREEADDLRSADASGRLKVLLAKYGIDIPEGMPIEVALQSAPALLRYQLSKDEEINSLVREVSRQAGVEDRFQRSQAAVQGRHEETQGRLRQGREKQEELREQGALRGAIKEFRGEVNKDSNPRQVIESASQIEAAAAAASGGNDSAARSIPFMFASMMRARPISEREYKIYENPVYGIGPQLADKLNRYVLGEVPDFVLEDYVGAARLMKRLATEFLEGRTRDFAKSYADTGIGTEEELYEKVRQRSLAGDTVSESGSGLGASIEIYNPETGETLRVTPEERADPKYVEWLTNDEED